MSELSEDQKKNRQHAAYLLNVVTVDKLMKLSDHLDEEIILGLHPASSLVPRHETDLCRRRAELDPHQISILAAEIIISAEDPCFMSTLTPTQLQMFAERARALAGYSRRASSSPLN